MRGSKWLLLLYGYATRPSWPVAGVHHAVGLYPRAAYQGPTAGNLQLPDRQHYFAPRTSVTRGRTRAISRLSAQTAAPVQTSLIKILDAKF